MSSRNDVGHQITHQVVACDYFSFHGFLCLWGLSASYDNCLSDAMGQKDVSTCERDACEFY